MISKRFMSFEIDGAPCTSLLETLSGRFSKDCLRKVAGDNTTWFADKVKPRPGYFYLLIVTNGDMSHYGFNSNGDAFNEDAMEYRGWGVPKGRPQTVMLDGGLKKYHKTYMEFGGCYRRHKNGTKTDPATGEKYKPMGKPIAEFYNEDLHRGELIVELPEHLWGDVLQKVLKGDPVAWSMGAGVPRDICSCCLNKAATRKEYCQCLKYHMGELQDNGRQIGAINDETYYHDISEVGTNPAMKIAYTLQKVAEDGHRPSQFDLSSNGLWLPPEMVRKMDVTHSRRYEWLQKLAKAEQLAGLKTKSIEKLTDAFELPEGAEEDAKKACAGIPHDQLFKDLADRKMVLPPSTFTTIVIRKSAPSGLGLDRWTDLVPQELNGIFSRILASQDLTEDVVNDGHYRPGLCPHCGGRSKVDDVKDLLSVDPESVRRRVIVAVVRGGEKPKSDIQKQAESYTEQEQRLAFTAALEYAKYQLSFATAVGGADLPETLVALNKSR